MNKEMPEKMIKEMPEKMLEREKMLESEKMPAAPTCVEEFTKSWAQFVLGRWLASQERGAQGLEVTKVEAKLNSQQGLLSTTYLVEIYFHTTSGGREDVLEEEERKSGGRENALEEEEKKSVFVK